MKKIIVLTLFPCSLAFAGVTSWEDSPMNYDNSEMNWENSEMNYNNSPMNWDNSPMNINSDRIIRDQNGNPTGYIVPKESGGSNIFDLDGNREGYIPN